MQEERKSLGGALVDVFDAGVTLVKSEIRALMRQVTNVIKAKGVGVVLLLASVGPLLMGLIFLILAVFYLLMRLGLGAWVAALIIALLGFILTGVLVMMGLRRLSAEMPHDKEDRRPRHPDQMTEDERLEAQYQAEQAAKARVTASGANVSTAPGTVAVAGGAAKQGRPGVDDRVPSSAADHVEGTVTFPMPLSEGRTETLPVYGTNPDNSQPAHGGSVDDFQVFDESGDSEEHRQRRHPKKHDPNIQHPVVLKDQPGIDVSTTPTFREDMKKEGY